MFSIHLVGERLHCLTVSLARTVGNFGDISFYLTKNPDSATKGTHNLPIALPRLLHLR